MRRMNETHTQSHLMEGDGSARPTHVDRSFDEPAVTAIVPMIAWCMAIFWADG
jgi:hypothetical protein